VPEAGTADALIARVRFDDAGLVACVCQDAATGEVLMVAYANADALRRTLTTRRATFWSRSRGELWEKGATSGNRLEVVDARLDCDGDAVLLEVVPAGPACHTGSRSCFGDHGGGVAGRLRATIAARASAPPESSYVARMLGAPRAHVARKLGEEAVEAIVEEPASGRLADEVADLWFHSMLLLARDGLDPLAPLAVLLARHGAGAR
jgi:phosphoribosyl-ATP pyrophosphohydrolase/phosphoribosyl-AMP cyclohydrolase